MKQIQMCDKSLPVLSARDKRQEYGQSMLNTDLPRVIQTCRYWLVYSLQNAQALGRFAESLMRPLPR